MKPGRNDPCPCGSGKKFKQCCEGRATVRAVEPSPAECNQLVALFNARRYAEMESQARAMVAQYPNSGFAWKLLGAALQMQGINAFEAFHRTTELMPDDAEAHFNLGVVLKSLGQLDEAVTSYRRALQLNPEFAEAHSNLGNTLKDLGQLENAVTSYRRAIMLRPSSAEAHNNLGTALKDLGQYHDAVASYQRAIALRPNYAEAYCNLGNALKELGQLNDAAASYRKATELNPRLDNAYNSLGNVLKELERPEEALACYRSALAANPRFTAAQNNLGMVLKDLGRSDEALASYRRALEIEPQNTDAMLGLGTLYTTSGKLDDARDIYEKVLAIQPGNMYARFLLANVGKCPAGDANLSALLAANDDASGTPLPQKDAIFMNFALGKCLADLGEHDESFRHFLAGCRLQRATFDYDAAKMTQQYDEVIRVFDRATMARLRGAGSASDVPVFVLGMPRSGTTLTEQIIASHPDVHGAGELADLQAVAQRPVAGISRFPDNILALDHDTLTAWGDDYAAGLRQRAPEARRIIDKMPNNFWFIGLIHAMLPNARIIHVNRNPLDTCLSCFTILFGGTLKFSYDLAELGRYYRDYARLMNHWRSVLPAGAFLEVQYEDIVADQETQARRMIEFCGLEWNDACLDFHKSQRQVKTASVAQVRRPIYRSSVERWRPYEQYLGPLLEELGDLAPQRN